MTNIRIRIKFFSHKNVFFFIHHYFLDLYISYPAKIQEDFHYVHCHLPAQLIYMLHKLPELVAVAVDAFYNRDQIDVKVKCSQMELM